MDIKDWEAKLKEVKESKDDKVSMQKLVRTWLKEIEDLSGKPKTDTLFGLLLLVLAADYDLRREFFEATIRAENQRVELNKVVKIQSFTAKMFCDWIRTNEDGIVGEIKSALLVRPAK